MQKKNNIVNEVSPVARLFVLISLVASLIIAKSIYLVLFISTLILIICIFNSIKVNTYVKFFKNLVFILLIFVIIYIIIVRENSFLQVLVVVYKIIFILIAVKTFEINTSFNELHEAIYGSLLPFRIFNIEKLSFNICIFLKFFKFWFDSKNQLKKLQSEEGNAYLSFDKIIFSRFIYSINNLNKFDLRLKINFYKSKYKKCNFKSRVIILISILFFILCIFKEVIL